MESFFKATNNRILNIAARARRAEIDALVRQQSNETVLSGPFAGMRLLAKTSWHDGDAAPKLLRCYESELFPFVERAIRRQPGVVINVGCAEGYYAIGLARRLPGARVFAFDLDEAAQTICREAAAANDTGNRVAVGGLCSAATLVELVRSNAAERPLIVMDCEGGERDLLTEAVVGELRACDAIVECHDFADRTITPMLTQRFGATHTVETVSEGPRDPAMLPLLRPLSTLDRYLAVCEFRPETMNWVIGWSRATRDLDDTATVDDKRLSLPR